MILFADGRSVMIAPGFVHGIVPQPVGAVQAEIGLEEQLLPRRLVLTLKDSIPIINHIAHNPNASRRLNQTSAEFLRPPDVCNLIHVFESITHTLVAVLILKAS